MQLSANQHPALADGHVLRADRRAHWISWWLALSTILFYLPAADHDFIIADDTTYITSNPMVTNGLSWAGFQWAFIGWHCSNWHPLTWLSHQLDCQLFGLHAGAHHLVSALFHAANAVLLFHLWWRLTKALWPSALVAMLFAWHPLHVESVAWASERKDVLSTFFGLLSLLAYARYAQATRAGTGLGRKDWWLALLFLALGLLAKPMLVTLPFVFLLLDFWPLARFSTDRRLLKESWQLAGEKWPFFLLSALSCLCTYLAQRHDAVVSLHRLPVDMRFENAGVAAASYLAKTLWPVNLCIFYPLPDHFGSGQVLLAVLVLAVVSVAAWRWRQTRRYLLTGWLWFLGMLVPVIGLVQVGEQSMADRYTYLPSIGLFVAAAFGLAELCDRGKIRVQAATLTVAMVLAACLVATERQLTFWRNNETLFKHAVAVTRHNGTAHMVLAVIYKGEGRTAEAMQHYHAAMADYMTIMVPAEGGGKRPYAAQVELNFGQVDEQKGDLDGAINDYREALKLDTNYFDAHDSLGRLLNEAGRHAEAVIEYQAVVRLRPEIADGHENLGTQLAQSGRFREALQEYQQAARLAPANSTNVYLIGRAFLRLGQSTEAVQAFQKALQLAPNDCATLTYLARVLASDFSPKIRNGSQAVSLAEKANTLSGGNQPFILDTLAMALAEAGRFEEAQTKVRTALSQKAGMTPAMVASLQAKLKLYAARQPFRDSFTNPPAQ